MSADRSHFSVVSLHVSRVLDEVGLNELTVKRRRQSLLLQETVASVCQGIGQRLLRAKKPCTVYHFGSQSEGTTTPGLDSDVDLLICDENIRVIQTWKEWVPGKTNMLMLQEHTAPGYCRLQVLRSDMPLPVEHLPDYNYVYDINKRVIVKNTLFHNIKIPVPQERNGPAIKNTSTPGVKDQDIIIGFRSYSRLPIPDRWNERNQRRQWPEQDLLLKVLDETFFLVPVGYKLSQTEYLEWRISTSLSERHLMFSMNMTQIKCYVILKMIIKTFITPVVGKSITSYHCKTAVFKCMERFECRFWRDGNLLNCIVECLKILKTWVAYRFCPQFMIPNANLFIGKVTIHNQQILKSLLIAILESNGRFFLQIETDKLGMRLESMISGIPQHVDFVDSTDTVAVVAEVEYNFYKNIGGRMCLLLVMSANTDQDSLIRFFYQDLTKLYIASKQPNTSERIANVIVIKLLSILLGSLLSAISLSRHQGIPHEALLWFRLGDQSDIASLLKLASVFYCDNNFGKVEQLLLDIEVRFSRDPIFCCCSCYKHSIYGNQEFYKKMYSEEEKKNRDKYVAHCVRFTPHEKHCAPPALRHELCRSVGDDIQHRDEILDNWMVLGVADSLPYLYYLQYINYRQLGKRDLQKKSLNNLDHCVRNNDELWHSETAWNFLGQCMELEQNPAAAMDCYRTSLEIRPGNNAANWHVQNLRYKHINGN